MLEDISPDQPIFSILIVNYNSGDNLSRCLDALEKQTMANFEAIIIDNDSRDGSFKAEEKMRSDPRLYFIANKKNLGFAAANNQAAKLAKAPWLATLNPDAFASLNWLEEMLAAIKRHPDVKMFGSTQIKANDETLFDGCGDVYSPLGIAWRGGYGAPVNGPVREGQVFSPCAAAAIYDREIFLDLDGFDERFFCFMEDVDLGFRWRLRGETCIQVPQAVVYHLGGGSGGSDSDFARYHGTRNAIWTFVKNMPGPLFYFLLPFHGALLVTFLLRGLVRGQGKPILKGIEDALGDIGETWNERRKIQKARTVRFWEIASSFCWLPWALLTRPTAIRLLK